MLEYPLNEENFPSAWDFPTNDPLIRRAIYKGFGGRDFYSDRKLTFEEMQIDHIIPRSDTNTGGIVGPDNIYNYVPCSVHKNAAKSNKVNWEVINKFLGKVKLTYIESVKKEYLKLKGSKDKTKPKKIKNTKKEAIRGIAHHYVKIMEEDIPFILKFFSGLQNQLFHSSKVCLTEEEAVSFFGENYSHVIDVVIINFSLTYFTWSKEQNGRYSFGRKSHVSFSSRDGVITLNLSEFLYHKMLEMKADELQTSLIKGVYIPCQEEDGQRETKTKAFGVLLPFTKKNYFYINGTVHTLSQEMEKTLSLGVLEEITQRALNNLPPGKYFLLPKHLLLEFRKSAASSHIVIQKIRINGHFKVPSVLDKRIDEFDDIFVVQRRMEDFILTGRKSIKINTNQIDYCINKWYDGEFTITSNTFKYPY